MLLSGPQISTLLTDGTVTGADAANINAASLDVRLGDYVLVNVPTDDAINPADKRTDQFKRCELPYAMQPGDFILAFTQETVNLPDDLSAQVVTKSSAARIGLDHATAGFCDAGFSGQITLEFVNHSKNTIMIMPGAKLVQLKFFRHEQAGFYSYRNKGQYNGSVGVEVSRGVK
jgi:dCTP deaminase